MLRIIFRLLLTAIVLGAAAAPLVAQPPLHPSLGHGDVYPGTLLHSGELTLAAVDLRLAGRAADVVFARTYRNQTVGFGPLGPGWTHAYEQNLRALSNGDVDYFDGRGLRHRFRRQSDRSLRSPPGVLLELEQHGGGWALIAPDRTTTRFDAWGRLTSISDPAHANGYGDNVIRFSHDAHDRLAEIIDTHGRRFRLSYDEQGLLETVRDPGGREVRYGYDSDGRLVSVTDPTGSTWRYGYAQPPRSDRTGYLHERDNLTSITDALGQKVLEVVYGTDAQGHADAVVEQRWGGGVTRIAYDFAAGTATVTDRRGAAHRYEHNAAGRPTSAQIGLIGAAQPAFQEQQAWSPRGLKNSTSRLDNNGNGWQLSHDGTNRLLQATAPGSEPDRWSFSYDAVDNQTARQHHERGILAESVAFPPDTSGRNRPASAGGVALGWDANGNLISKGNLRFAYDIHNRLTRVTNTIGTELARYDYDALGRRVRKTYPDATALETTYSGWRELEEYRNGQIAARNTFGLGLDEIVRLELDQDGDGLLEQALVPVYDGAGNLAMLLTPEGRIAGKYGYSPFGDKLKAKVDNIPPSIEQLRLERQPDGVLRIEINLGEAIDGRRISTGFSLAPLPEPQAGTKSTATKQSLAIETYQPIQDGRRARRRVIVTATDPPEAGGELDLQVGVQAIADLFQNQLAEPFTMRLTVPTAGAAPQLLLDTADPQVDEVRLSDGHLEVSFSEQPDATAAATALRIDSATVSWSLLPESYTLRSEQPLAAGAHVIRIEQGAPLDLAGKGVSQTFEQSFMVDGVQPIAAIFEAPDPRDVPLETLANRFTFQGRPFDAETGLFYFRNRSYDPEIGRFITPDPLGYVDGPSRYAFAGYSPFNYGDPYGLTCFGIFDKDCSEYLPEFGRGHYRRERERLIAMVQDEALSPAERWSAAGRVNAQIPLWAFEELGRGLFNTPFSFASNAEGAAEDYAAAVYLDGEDAFKLYSRGTGRIAFAFVEGVGGAEGFRGLTALGSRALRGGTSLAEVPASMACAGQGCEFLDDGVRMVEQPLSGPIKTGRFLARENGEILDLSRIRIPGPRDTTQGKIDYLLGRVASEASTGKGGFFRGVMSFTDDSLEAVLRRHLAENFGTAVVQGNRVMVIGLIEGPSGRIASVRSVWQITDDGFVDLVTAFPE